VIIKYKRFIWRKGDREEKKGRQTNIRIAILRTNMRIAILSHKKMKGSCFLLPLIKGIEAKMREAILKMMT
tara:strand:- start:478 stop:690 length:213 start_codon:yes stop_codon:yes gene_type:complete